MRKVMASSESRAEERALRRWRPGIRWYHPAIAFAVIRLSRFVLSRMNRLEIEGVERFDGLHERGSRGLLTFSNHVSMFNDPLLLANLGLPKYSEIRWVAADALSTRSTSRGRVRSCRGCQRGGSLCWGWAESG